MKIFNIPFAVIGGRSHCLKFPSSRPGLTSKPGSHSGPKSSNSDSSHLPRTGPGRISPKVVIYFASAITAFLGNGATAALFDNVLLIPEQTEHLTEPWTAVPITPAQLTTDGKLLVPVQSDQQFWRLRATPASELGFSLGLPLINVPPTALKVATDFLASRMAAPNWTPDFGEQWETAKLADTVIPVYDAGIDGGRTPAYLEFKVVPDEPAPVPGSYRTTPGALKTDLGFILVSLTDNDFPVADWATEGETRIEKLRRRAGTSQIKPMRFGGALLVAEERGGGVLATEGSVLSRPSPDLLSLSNYVGTSSADTRTGESNRSPDLKLETPLQPYASYMDMKADYQTNIFFQVSRDRLKSAARLHWLIENGTPPEIFRVQVGQTATFLAGRDVTAARLETPGEGAMVARLTPLRLAGLRVDGLAPGSGVLYVEVDGKEDLFTLFVAPEGTTLTTAKAAFTPGWRSYTNYYAGSQSDQRWYAQYQSLVFGGGGKGNYVGCGPCAWTMLMGWWDLKGVPVIFKPYFYGSGILNWQLGVADAPASNDGLVQTMMHDFRDNWIDPLFCDVVSGQCGTLPDKMSGGVDYFAALRFLYNTVYLPFLGEDVLGYGYHIKWSYFPNNGVNDFNKLARESIRDGHPSIIGIGNLVHYPLAYAYLESRYELAPGYFPYYRAWFKCNWGNGDWHYYKFTDDLFFATKCQFWQTHTNYVP
jgi:hypothetical protein